MPQTGASSLSLGSLARAQDPEVDEWRRRLFVVATKILDTYVPDQCAAARRKVWLKGSYLPNSDGSLRLTNAQLNVSDQDQDLAEAITTRFGDAHTNGHDDPVSTDLFVNSLMPNHMVPLQRFTFKAIHSLRALTNHWVDFIHCHVQLFEPRRGPLWRKDKPNVSMNIVCSSPSSKSS